MQDKKKESKADLLAPKKNVKHDTIVDPIEKKTDITSSITASEVISNNQSLEYDNSKAGENDSALNNNEEQKGKSHHIIKKKQAHSQKLRKCHHCKISNTSYLRCHFWCITGTKCSKTYCKDCITSNPKYLSGDYDSMLKDSEWHCPSCRAVCECDVCVKEKKRNERRTSSFDRRSVVRATGLYKL